MITIFERVSTALGSLSPAVPYAIAPYKSTGALPDVFIAYELISGNPEAHADNVETARTYLVQVSIFSRAGFIGLPDVDAAMLAQDFVKSDWRQLPQDPETFHYGLAKDYTFTEFF